MSKKPSIRVPVSLRIAIALVVLYVLGAMIVHLDVTYNYAILLHLLPMPLYQALAVLYGRFVPFP